MGAADVNQTLPVFLQLTRHSEKGRIWCHEPGDQMWKLTRERTCLMSPINSSDSEMRILREEGCRRPEALAIQFPRFYRACLPVAEVPSTLDRQNLSAGERIPADSRIECTARCWAIARHR